MNFSPTSIIFQVLSLCYYYYSYTEIVLETSCYQVVASQAVFFSMIIFLCVRHENRLYVRETEKKTLEKHEHYLVLF